MQIRTLGVTVALALTLAACGSDDQAASAAIAKAIVGRDNQIFHLSRDQAGCIGDGLVEDIGTDQLVEYGFITVDNRAPKRIVETKMSESDAGSAATVMQDCAEIKEAVTAALGEVPDDTATCIETQLTDDVLHDYLVAVFMDDAKGGTQTLGSSLQDCL